MESLKVRVENEIESREAQELFFELGAKPRSVLENWKNNDYQFAWFALGKSGELFNEIVFRDNDSGISCSTMFKEITLPQLRDLVVLKRNDVGDATHIGKNGSEYHIGDKSYFWDGVGWEQRDFAYFSKLKPIEKKEMSEEATHIDEDGDYWKDVKFNADGEAYCGGFLRKGIWLQSGINKLKLKPIPQSLNDIVKSAEEFRVSQEEYLAKDENWNTSTYGDFSVLWQRDNPEELKSIGFDLGAEGADKSVSIENPLFPDFELSEPVVESNDFNGLDKSEINHRVAKAFNVIRGTYLNEDDIHFLRQLIDLTTSHYWNKNKWN